MLKCAQRTSDQSERIYGSERKRKAGRDPGQWRANCIYELLHEHGTGLATPSLIHGSLSGILA